VANELEKRENVNRPGEDRWDQEEEHQLLGRLKESETAFEDAMLRVSRYYSKQDEPQIALTFMERLGACTTDPEKKAFCFLSMGQLMEQGRDYDAAIEYYMKALLLEPSNSCSWYFIHNNIGCCLNHSERFDEAEEYCREAIRIDSLRYNAYINLGVSLEAQGRYLDAARSFVNAMNANASDIELVQHLEDLLSQHDEIGSGISEIHEVIRFYRERNGM
jgi:tetratricopeptide (TPR) repeat protein